MRNVLLATAAACGALAPWCAKAAEPSSSATVTEVVVTAERRPEVLHKLPVAATALSGTQIQQSGGLGVAALQFLTPSMTIQTGDTETNINIRGIGKGEFDLINTAGVIVYWDGVTGFSTLLQTEPFFDIGSVEVYRGPQGTFGGANASGGAIFVNTSDPNFNGYHGNFYVGYGNYNDAQFQGAVNLPVSDTLSLRLAANLESRDSFFHVAGPHTGDPGRMKDASGRFGLHWKPNSSFDLLLKAEYNYLDRGGNPASDASNPFDEAQPNPANPFDIYSDVHNMAIDRILRTSLKMSYVFSDGVTLRSITGYEYGSTAESFDDSMGNEGLPNSPYPPIWFRSKGSDRLVSEEINLVSPDTGPLKWIGGLYYQSEQIGIPVFEGGLGTGQAGVPPNLLLSATGVVPTETEAVFGQITYNITPALQIAVGGRFTWSQEQLNVTETLYAGGVPALVVPAIGPYSDRKPTGKISINYQVNSNNMLYALVATGHKAGGANDSPVSPATVVPPYFKSEDVTDYEIGVKSTFLDGHLRTQLDAYYNDYKNFQLLLFIPMYLNTEIANAGGTTVIDGVEFQGQGVFGNFRVDANASYLHSRIGHFVAADQCSISPVVGLDPGCDGQPLNVTGHPKDYAPDWTANIGVQYDFHLPNGGTLTPRVNYSYTSSQWGTLFDLPVDLLGPRNLVNAQLAYTQGRYVVTAYATNLFNLTYIDSGIEGGTRYPGAPRQFGLRLGMNF
ncbi:MAG TPA: TonB-dependent receptor [Caulobacteraceae bacterium]|nr:TonB-dependent receptor [Caulobacteraceae bacterium]